MKELHRFWGTLDQLDPADPDTYLEEGLESLQRVLGGTMSYLFVASSPTGQETDAGKSVHVERFVFSRNTSAKLRRSIKRDVKSKLFEKPGYSGDFAAPSSAGFSGAIVENTFQRPDIVRTLRRMELCSALIGGCRTLRGMQVYVQVSRATGESKFGAKDLRLLHAALSGASDWLGRCAVLLGSGLSRKPLPPRARDVLGLALRGESEERISELLDMTPGTTHQYVMSVYRHFGVSSRNELIRTWTFDVCEEMGSALEHGELYFGDDEERVADQLSEGAERDTFAELAAVRTRLMAASPRLGNRYLHLIFEELRELLQLDAGHVTCSVRASEDDRWQIARVAIKTWDRPAPVDDLKELLENLPSLDEDPFVGLRLKRGQRGLVALRQDVADLETWRKTRVYGVMEANGVTERAVVVLRVNRLCNITFGFDRAPDSGPFDERCRTILEVLAAGLETFAWRCAVILGTIRGGMPVARREREVLGYVLAGSHDPEIAESMAITLSTVQAYNSGIYGNLDVRGRTELMALWLPNREALVFD